MSSTALRSVAALAIPAVAAWGIAFVGALLVGIPAGPAAMWAALGTAVYASARAVVVVAWRRRGGVSP